MKYNFEKEIFEQPELLKEVLSKKINIACNKSIKQVIFIASGSSKNVSDFGAYFFEQIAKIPAKVEYASELLGKNTNFSQKDLVIFVSQSGKSADVLEVSHKIKDLACEKIALVNNLDSPIAKNSNFIIDMEAGVELAVPATKSFSLSFLKLYMLRLLSKML